MLSYLWKLFLRSVSLLDTTFFLPNMNVCFHRKCHTFIFTALSPCMLWFIARCIHLVQVFRKKLAVDMFGGFSWMVRYWLSHIQNNRFFTVRQSQWLEGEAEMRLFVGEFTLKWRFSLPLSWGCFDREGSFACHSSLSMSAAGLSHTPIYLD